MENGILHSWGMLYNWLGAIGSRTQNYNASEKDEIAN